MTANIEVTKGGVTSTQGFQSAGAHIGLRRKRKDLAVLFSETACNWAATFTTNSAKAAPVLWNQQLHKNGDKIHAIVINSAIANSCTGAVGLIHTKEMAETTADCLAINANQVLVASTGVIGVHLPIEIVKSGIQSTVPLLTNTQESSLRAAEAITTTDTFVKQCAVQFYIGDKLVTLGAMAKGSGMVHPNMATMLAFVTTDLNIEQSLLQKALSANVSKTFNMISVDGDMSTNDMVIILANGEAGNENICDENNEHFIHFVHALDVLNTHLSRLVASDGEGASKLLEVCVTGASTLEAARKMARCVVSSNLVKVALFAEDANWGRIVGAMGASGIPFDFNKLALTITSSAAPLPLVIDGMPYWTDDTQTKEALTASEVKLLIELGEGESTATAWGCDLSFDYVQKSGNYRKLQKLEQGTITEVREGAVA